MLELKQILEFFKKGDLKKLRDLIKINSGNDQQLKEKLLDYILGEKQPNDGDASVLIYNTGEKSKFSHLKKRLSEDIYKIVFIQNNNRLYDDELPRKKVACRKLIIIGEWLINRGAKEAGFAKLRKALSIANKYYFYYEKLAMLDLFLIYSGIKNKWNKFNDFSKEIDATILELKDSMKMKEYAYRIGLLDNFKSNIDIENNEEIIGIINQAKLVKEQSNDSNTDYWYFILESNVYLIKKEFENALIWNDKVLAIIKENPSVYGIQRLIAFLIAKANILFRLQRYIELQNLLTDSIKPILYSKTHNEFRYYELEFRIGIEKCDFEKCIYFLDKLKRHTRSKIAFNYNRVVLYEAFYFFRKDDKERALSKIRSVQELVKDKSGWLFGIYFLEILCLFDLGEFGQVSYKIDNLNHLIFRQKNKNIVRIKLILKIIKSFIRCPNNAEKVYKQHCINFVKLKSSRDEYYWDPLGFEVIRFDDWFAEKMKNHSSLSLV